MDSAGKGWLSEHSIPCQEIDPLMRSVVPRLAGKDNCQKKDGGLANSLQASMHLFLSHALAEELTKGPETGELLDDQLTDGRADLLINYFISWIVAEVGLLIVFKCLILKFDY